MNTSRLKALGLAALLSTGLAASSSALAQASCNYVVTPTVGAAARRQLSR